MADAAHEAAAVAVRAVVAIDDADTAKPVGQTAAGEAR
jgi:hypothetical protein